jgi:hypothetical protein
MPTQGGESRTIKLTSPGGAADPPVRVSHLRRDKPIDGKKKSLQATRLPYTGARVERYCLRGRRRTCLSTVEEAVDGMPQAFPINRLSEVRREARCFSRGDVTL